MKPATAVPTSVDDYLAGLPPDVRALVQRVRRAIHRAAPGVEERISYQIPTFTLDGTALIHVAAFKSHLGLYPAPAGDAAFTRAIAPYRSGKATLKFKFDEPLPLSLVASVVRFRRRAVLEQARGKAR
jgi:uncharacterized protein YdhG (YjbR/CyaY superfamily)